MKNTIRILIALMFTLESGPVFARGRIQNEDVKSLSEVTAAGGTAANLINDTKLYVSSNGINDTFANAIINGQLGGAGGGAVGVELLTNPGFESGGVSSGWLSSGGLFTVVTSGSNLIAGKKTASFTASAVGQMVNSTPQAIKGLSGGNCSAQISYLYAGAAGDYSFQAFDGTNVLNAISLPPSTSAANPQTITFPCGALPASTLQWRLISNVASPSSIYFDNNHLGSLTLFQGLVNGQPTNIIRYLSGSGNYTPTSGVTQVEVMMVGGGGGGAGSGGGSSAGAGGAGGATTFGGYTAGAGGGATGANGPAGTSGLYSGSQSGSVLVEASNGARGQGTATTGGTALVIQGGMGGSSRFTAAGGGGGAALAGSVGEPNSGSGGGGASYGGTNGNSGAGGGAGAYLDFILPQGSIPSTVTYSVGTGGTAGAAGSTGSTGNGGGSGIIIVRETFNAVAASAYLPSAGGLSAGQVTGTFASACPVGTIPADGSAVSRTAYPALFAAMGTTYGVGDGSTTFNLPNALGAFLRGAGTQTFGGTTYSAVQGTSQADMFLSHTHSGAGNNYPYGSDGVSVANNGGFAGPVTSAGALTKATGGTETRPFNIALKYCVQTAPASAAPLMVNSVVSTDNSAGTTIINTSQTFTAAATIPTTIETAFGDTTTAAFALTLPSPSLNKSKKLLISKVNSGANLLAVTGSIAGVTRSTFLHGQSEQIQLQSDGTTWQWLSDSYRTEYVHFSGSSSGNCGASSTCTILSVSGNWVSSITTDSTSTATVSIPSGIFSNAPTCTASAITNGTAYRSGFCTAPSTTSLTVRANDGSGNPFPLEANVIVRGPR